jgi:hypothetical protein
MMQVNSNGAAATQPERHFAWAVDECDGSRLPSDLG